MNEFDNDRAKDRSGQSAGQSIVEYVLLGQAIYMAQHIEFGLYMIASHLSHTDAAQKDGRLKNLNPDAFMKGDPTDFKVTLGQLVHAFGDHLMLSTPEFMEYRDDRNIIAHNYYRMTSDSFSGSRPLKDKFEFLKDFIERSEKYAEIVSGLLHVMIRGKIHESGFGDLIPQDEVVIANMESYIAHTAEYKAHIQKVAPTP